MNPRRPQSLHLRNAITFLAASLFFAAATVWLFRRHIQGPDDIILFLLALFSAMTLTCTLGIFTEYHHHRATRRPWWHCPHCGYDLRASPTRCPECGTPR